MNKQGGNSGNRNNKKSSFTKKGSVDKNKTGEKSASGSKYSKPFKKDDKPFKRDDKPFKKWTNDKPAATSVAKPTVSKTDEIRLNKYVSNSGVCSRRDADLYIQSGNVTVNGEPITEMGYKVKLDDKVVFDGVVLNPEKKVYVLLNKPKGFSTSDDENVSSAYDLVRNASTSVLRPVGRMDKSTVGLLLYTNDNEMIQKFTNTAQHSSKLYQVSLDKNLKFEDLEKVQTGVYINEHKVWVEEVSYVENQPKSEVGVKLKTSNVKVVRAIFEKLGYNVIKLDRVMYAGLTKWGIARGQWRFLNEQEVINLKNLK